MPWGFVRSLLSVTVVAIALSLATLVSLARLDRKFVWALYTHYISLAGLTGILISLIWFDEALEVDLTLRVLGVFAIIAGAMTIMIPVFHRLSRVQDEAVWIDDEILELERRIEELKIKRESLKKPEEEGGAEAP